LHIGCRDLNDAVALIWVLCAKKPSAKHWHKARYAYDRQSLNQPLDANLGIFSFFSFLKKKKTHKINILFFFCSLVMIYKKTKGEHY